MQFYIFEASYHIFFSSSLHSTFTTNFAQVFSNKIVYSNETSLYFEGYSDQVPFTYTVTVPRGYHSKILWNDFIVCQTPLELFDKGIKEITSPYGNPIKIYCIERTLCDLLRSRNDFNKERYIPAVQKYMRSKQKDTYKIMEYAKLLNVENKIRPYLEVLLWKQKTRCNLKL